MLCLQGKSVYKGIAMGPAVVLGKKDSHIVCKKIEDTEKEILRTEQAIKAAKAQLRELYESAAKIVGKVSAAIFDAHIMILEDAGFLQSIFNLIENEKINAEYAVVSTEKKYAELFKNMDDEIMQSREADIKDVTGRILWNLGVQKEVSGQIKEPSVIIADDLSPGETMQMDKEKVLAFVLVHGSVNSHTAVLARMMNVPALVGVPLTLEETENGVTVIVDGYSGQVVFEPDKQTCEKTAGKIKKEAEKQKLLQELKGKENITLDGKRIEISANIGSPEDTAQVEENDAGGIGLLRSEFLYLGRNDFPSEEEQYQVYRQIAEQMKGQKVIIRTLDIGVDKQVDYFCLGKEENPALGYRGIRICLKQPEVFKVQLRALFRAAVCGNLAIMYPMITSVEEVEQITEIAEEVKRELDERSIPYRIPSQGIMIETPAAVMISDELAQMVDFFSIGTNDLAQYTLAIDRQNAMLDDFYNPYHKALLRMIKLVVDNAHKYGKHVGICGEMGADTKMTKEYIKIGVDELSVTPSMVLPLRKVVREMNCSAD